MYIKETYSTSSLLRERYSEEMPHLFTIRTDYQTAGRGQAGNSWESEAEKNVLFSTLLRYAELPAAAQWRISMLVAVVTREVLAKYLPQEALRIKWPNDIYYGDKKLVGILIENSLAGKNIGYSIAGIGINANQTQWRSNAPNPISMKEITGEEYDVAALVKEWIASLKSWENQDTAVIKQAYMEHLYRRNGEHAYVEREVSTVPTAIASEQVAGQFLASIDGISEQGELLLRLENGEKKCYHFKQIRFVIG